MSLGTYGKPSLWLVLHYLFLYQDTCTFHHFPSFSAKTSAQNENKILSVYLFACCASVTLGMG